MQYFHQYAKHGFVVTIEDNTLVGGLGTEIKELIAEKQLSNVTVKTFGYPYVFVEHVTVQQLEKIYKVDEKAIFNYIKNEINHKNKIKNDKSFYRKSKGQSFKQKDM